MRLLDLFGQGLAAGAKVSEFTKDFPAEDVRRYCALPGQLVSLEALLNEL